MARRLFLHVGTPKTGTSYLQSVIWANKSRLEDSGLLLPLSGVHEHFYLSTVARDVDSANATLPPAGGSAWPRMLEQLADWDRDALVSHELFAAATRARVAWVRGELADVIDSLHVIVTARDFARQVPAEWQQEVKHGLTQGLREFCEQLKATDPTLPREQRDKDVPFFWPVQNLPRVLDRWGSGLAPEQVHLVTVPPSGAPRAQLWERFASVLDIPHLEVDLSVTSPNESLGVDEIETLRRVNALIPADFPTPQVSLIVKQLLSDGTLASRSGTRKVETPPDLHAWMVERGTAMVTQLRRRSCTVIGHLDELLPAPHPARGSPPDDVDDGAVADIAVDTIATLLLRRDDPATQRLAAQQRALAGELDKRASRIDELREALKQERMVLEWERHHPVRTHVRRTGGRLRRLLRSTHSRD